MSLTLQGAAYRLHGLERVHEMVSRNLANSSSPGYRPEVWGVESAPLRGKAPPSLPETSWGQSPLHGPIRVSQDPYAFALESDGYFSVQGPNGEILYTRDGEFSVSPEGTLVTKQGFPVLVDGAPLELPIEEGPPRVGTDGAVAVGETAAGTFSVVSFAAPERLVAVGGGFFTDPTGAAEAAPTPFPGLRQGHLEGSGVEPIREMVSLLTVSKAYALTQKAVQAEEERGRQVLQYLLPT